MGKVSPPYLLLKDLGYDVKFVGGSVFHPVTGQPGNPNEHVLSVVTLDEKAYIVDVGFGAKCALEPLTLAYGEELQDPNGIFRYTKENDMIEINDLELIL